MAEEYKRLNKVLSDAGVSSRRAADLLIEEGRVTVNKKVIRELGVKVRVGADEVRVDGELIKPVTSKEYYILHKPKGYVCSNARIDEGRIVFDLIDSKAKRLFTIGRLDKDTEGLLLITNDGSFAQAVIHPSSNIKKEYIAKVAADVTDEHLQIMHKGVFIDGRRIRPHKVEKVRKGTIKVVLSEGKNHEVKALLEKADLALRELKRVRIGNLRLGTMPKGAFRSLSERERALIFE